jgi:alkaline phosphatase D
LMRRRVDLRLFPVPENLQRELLISGDDWDGAPNRRTALLTELAGTENVVVLTGDLHSFFCGTIGVPGGENVVEFVTGAVSSATYRAILEQSGISLPGLGDVGIAAGLLLMDANPHMAYQELNNNGFATVEVAATEFQVTLHQISFEKLREQQLAGSLEDHFVHERFRLLDGSAVLQREMDGEYRSWSEADRRWIKS